MGTIEITGWEQAEKLIKALIINGYQVLVGWDGEFNTHTGDEVIRKDRTYHIQYIHPNYEDDYFILYSEILKDGQQTEE